MSKNKKLNKKRNSGKLNQYNGFKIIPCNSSRVEGRRKNNKNVHFNFSDFFFSCTDNER